MFSYCEEVHQNQHRSHDGVLLYSYFTDLDPNDVAACLFSDLSRASVGKVFVLCFLREISRLFL